MFFFRCLHLRLCLLLLISRIHSLLGGLLGLRLQAQHVDIVGGLCLQHLQPFGLGLVFSEQSAVFRVQLVDKLLFLRLGKVRLFKGGGIVVDFHGGLGHLPCSGIVDFERLFERLHFLGRLLGLLPHLCNGRHKRAEHNEKHPDPGTCQRQFECLGRSRTGEQGNLGLVHGKRIEFLRLGERPQTEGGGGMQRVGYRLHAHEYTHHGLHLGLHLHQLLLVLGEHADDARANRISPHKPLHTLYDTRPLGGAGAVRGHVVAHLALYGGEFTQLLLKFLVFLGVLFPLEAHPRHLVRDLHYLGTEARERVGRYLFVLLLHAVERRLFLFDGTLLRRQILFELAALVAGGEFPDSGLRLLVLLFEVLQIVNLYLNVFLHIRNGAVEIIPLLKRLLQIVHLLFRSGDGAMNRLLDGVLRSLYGIGHLARGSLRRVGHAFERIVAGTATLLGGRTDTAEYAFRFLRILLHRAVVYARREIKPAVVRFHFLSE